MKWFALSTCAALLGATTVSASAAVHGNSDVTRQAMHRRGAQRIQRLTKRAEAAALLAVQNSTSTATDALSTTAIWWAEEGWTGSCGVKIDNSAAVVGLPISLYPNADAKSSLCGETAYAVNPATGQSVTVTVVDGSDRSAYATFSKSAYLALGGNLDTGMLPITLSLSQTAANLAASVPASAASSAQSSVVSSANASAPSSAAVNSTSSVSQQAVSSAAKTTTTTTEAPVTTSAPAVSTTTVDQAAINAASSSSQKAFEQQQSYQLAAQASSQSAAAQASADAAWASSSSAAAAAASQSAADAAWASSSSAAAAAAASSQAAADAAASQAAAAAAASSQAAAQAAASAAAEQQAQQQAQEQAQQQAKQSSGGQTYSGGYATYYTQNGVAGNCGSVNPDSAYIVALPTATYAGGSNCGKQVTITRVSTGKTIQATVADSCPTCVNNACLDLSVAAFTAIATEAEGMVDITWSFS